MGHCISREAGLLACSKHLLITWLNCTHLRAVLLLFQCFSWGTPVLHLPFGSFNSLLRWFCCSPVIRLPPLLWSLQKPCFPDEETESKVLLLNFAQSMDHMPPTNSYSISLLFLFCPCCCLLLRCSSSSKFSSRSLLRLRSCTLVNPGTKRVIFESSIYILFKRTSLIMVDAFWSPLLFLWIPLIRINVKDRI